MAFWELAFIFSIYVFLLPELSPTWLILSSPSVDYYSHLPPTFLLDRLLTVRLPNQVRAMVF